MKNDISSGDVTQVMSGTSLFVSLHFWSAREDLVIRDTDFGVFQFWDKQVTKDIQEGLRGPYAKDKHSYCRLRGHQPSVEAKDRGDHGKQTQNLRQSLKELEVLLNEQTVVFSKFRHSFLYQIIFNSGTLLNIQLNKLGDVSRIHIDKYLCGKIQDGITDVDFSKKAMIITYLEPKVTIISFGKNIDFFASSPESLEKSDPRVKTLTLLGPSGRRIHRHVLLSPCDAYLLVWWSSSEQEVFPWAPNLKEEDTANVILYETGSLSRIGFIRTQSDPLEIRFTSPEIFQVPLMLDTPNCFLLFFGQDTSRRGEVLFENTILHPVRGIEQLRRKNPKKIKLNVPITCHDVHEDFMILGLSDGTLMMLDIFNHQVCNQTKASFIPFLIRIHPDGGFFMVASERGLVQCYDIGLTQMRLQYAHNDQLSSIVLDIGQHFQSQVSLASFHFCSRLTAPLVPSSDKCAITAVAHNYVLFRFQDGPLVLGRMNSGVLNAGSLGPVQFVNQYLRNAQYHQILLLLSQLNWARQGDTLIMCIAKTLNKLMRAPFSKEVEAYLEMCLGLYYNPMKPVEDKVLDEYADHLRDMSRRFFHHLLRHGQAVKAYQMAVDIDDYDLFVNLHHAASKLGIGDLADASIIKANAIYEEIQEDKNAGDAIPDNVNGEGHTLSTSSRSSTDGDSLPPPPPTPPPLLEARNQALPQPPPPADLGIPYSGSVVKQSLPSPMQIFSAVTTVQVDHPPTSSVPDYSKLSQPNLIYASAAKKIPTNEFQISPQKSQSNTSYVQRERTLTSFRNLSISNPDGDDDEEDDIEVVHFGLV